MRLRCNSDVSFPILGYLNRAKISWAMGDWGAAAPAAPSKYAPVRGSAYRIRTMTFGFGLFSILCGVGFGSVRVLAHFFLNFGFCSVLLLAKPGFWLGSFLLGLVSFQSLVRNIKHTARSSAIIRKRTREKTQLAYSLSGHALKLLANSAHERTCRLPRWSDVTASAGVAQYFTYAAYIKNNQVGRILSMLTTHRLPSTSLPLPFKGQVWSSCAPLLRSL